MDLVDKPERAVFVRIAWPFAMPPLTPTLATTIGDQLGLDARKEIDDASRKFLPDLKSGFSTPPELANLFTDPKDAKAMLQGLGLNGLDTPLPMGGVLFNLAGQKFGTAATTYYLSPARDIITHKDIFAPQSQKKKDALVGLNLVPSNLLRKSDPKARSSLYLLAAIRVPVQAEYSNEAEKKVADEMMETAKKLRRGMIVRWTAAGDLNIATASVYRSEADAVAIYGADASDCLAHVLFGKSLDTPLVLSSLEIVQAPASSIVPASSDGKRP